MIRHFRIYGAQGHRQKASFNESVTYNFDDYNITFWNSDTTGTNEYTEVIIECSTSKHYKIMEILDGQLSDGYFENCRYGKVTELNFIVDDIRDKNYLCFGSFNNLKNYFNLDDEVNYNDIDSLLSELEFFKDFNIKEYHIY